MNHLLIVIEKGLKDSLWRHLWSSVFLVICDQMPLNRNLGPLIIYEWQFTEWSIDYLDNWRLCVFLTKIFTVLQYLFFAKKIKSSKKPLSGIKIVRLFSHYTIAPKWSRDRIFEVGKSSTVFFQKLLKSIFKKSELVL